MGRFGSQRAYNLYGVCLKSVMPLPGPAVAGPGRVVVEFVNGSTSLFSKVRRETGFTPEKSDWFQYARLLDGSTFLRWSGLFEFLVSADGRRIACRELNGANRCSGRRGGGGVSWRLRLWEVEYRGRLPTGRLPLADR